MYNDRQLDPATQRALDQVGSVILQGRIARGWSQRTLEDRSGVDQTTISRLERGLLRGVRVEAFARILAALGITIAGRG